MWKMPVQSYRELVAWQKAMELAADVYRITKTFPHDELYGITGQLRRASVSVPANIAEGQGRQTTGEFRQFLGHAPGSLLETETHILLAVRLRYIPEAAGEVLLKQTAELGKVLNGLMASLREGRR